MWIRWPSEKLVRHDPLARLVRINLHHPEVPADIAVRSVSFASGADAVLDALYALSRPTIRPQVEASTSSP